MKPLNQFFRDVQEVRNDNLLARIIIAHKPQIKTVVELGTSVGVTAKAIMDVLPEDGKLTSINLPNPPEWYKEMFPNQNYSGDNVAIQVFEKYGDDPRFKLILGNSIDMRWNVTCPTDLLYIDSNHVYDYISQEWRAYESAMMDGGIVVVDDINHNDMMRFWHEIPYEKVITDTENGIPLRGMFRYRREMHLP